MYVYTVDSKVRIQRRQTPEMYKKLDMTMTFITSTILGTDMFKNLFRC